MFVGRSAGVWLLLSRRSQLDGFKMLGFFLCEIAYKSVLLKPLGVDGQCFRKSFES